MTFECQEDAEKVIKKEASGSASKFSDLILCEWYK